MLIVAALGGNALLQRGEKPDAGIQHTHVAAAVEALAPLARDHALVVTHGNGPQVGQLALESLRDPDLSEPYPFDALVAQTQGMIGYWLLQAFQNALPGRPVVALVSETVVDADDAAFRAPTKFVGPGYEEAEARRLTRTFGWTVRQDGTAWRRVVASPEPRDLVGIGLVRLLLDHGAVVISSGGGGIPVAPNEQGELLGMEAVVDKDLTGARLACELGADAFLLLTDVPAVQLDYGSPSARAIGRVTPAELRAHVFAAGSMGPKVEAACRFVEATGNPAMIGQLDDAPRLADGSTGTVVRGGPVRRGSPPEPGARRPATPPR